MNSKPYLQTGFFALVVALASPFFSLSAHGNVYATNVKLNGGANNVTNAPGDSVSVSYVLNENATRGVTVRILNATGVVRSIALPPNTGGTFKGANSVLWDGKDTGGNTVAAGSYTVSITAAATGYDAWTQITDDTNPWTFIYEGRGIAVNQNTNSPYYGRIFVVNSVAGPNPGTSPGDRVGILKLNADASPADEGATNDMGYAWQGGEFSPWKIEVAADDYVYVNDLFPGTNGTVLRWDQTLSTNSLQPVLRPDNIPAGAELSGAFVVGQGASRQIWMADRHSPGSLGILRWSLTPEGVCATNDLGTTVFGTGGSVLGSPNDVSVDRRGNVYACSFASQALDPAARVFSFAPYDPATNSGAPQLAATWAVGGGLDAFAGASAVAVDPTGTYVAVALWGIDYLRNGSWDLGSTYILYATNGAIATNLDFGIAMGGMSTTEHKDTDCAWDAVGNVYYVDAWYGVWRAYSPPGTNQATTVAAPSIQVVSPIPTEPVITSLTVAGSYVLIDFTGSAGDKASSFTLFRAPLVAGPYFPAPEAVITNTSPTTFRAVLATAAGSSQYYKVERVTTPPVQTPSITELSFAGGFVLVDFTGSPGDTSSSFTLFRSPLAAGPYFAAAGSVITNVGPTTFRAVVPASPGPIQFYKVERATAPSIQSPRITGLGRSAGVVSIDFVGSDADPAEAFGLLSSASAAGTYAFTTGSSITSLSPGHFRATAPATAPTQFYRISR